jgi:hypothetical protein
MLYRALADAVLVLHLAFILFVMLGGLLVLRRPWLAWLHLPAAIWGALIEFAGWICPLTPLEIQLRVLAGEDAYRGGFISHYVMTLIYPDGLTREIQWLLGTLVLAVNAAVYLRFWRKRKASRG